MKTSPHMFTKRYVHTSIWSKTTRRIQANADLTFQRVPHRDELKANREMVSEWGGLQSFNDHRKWWYMAASLEDHIEERQSKWEPSYFLDISRLPLNLEFSKPWVFVGIDPCFNFRHLTWHFPHQRGFSFTERNQPLTWSWTGFFSLWKMTQIRLIS